MSPQASRSALPTHRESVRVLACLYMGGAAIGLTTIVLIPPPPEISLAGVLTPCLAGLLCGLFLWLLADRVHRWAVPVALALGTALISVALGFGTDVRTGGEILYLWVGVYAVFTTPRAVAWAEIAFAALCYGIVLIVHHEPSVGPRWTITVATLVVAGVFVSRIVGQLDRLLHRANEREDALIAAEERFRSAFDDAAIGMALVDLGGRWTRVNQALARITGYPVERLVGMSFRELTPAEDVGNDNQALDRLLSGELATYQAEKRYLRADGEVVWVSLCVSVVRDADGKPKHLISQMQDISARKEAVQELSKRALHDPLTGLPNRRLFTDRVDAAVSLIDRNGPLAVLFVDLDRFKLVNDSLGHAAGDLLLVSVAERLRTHVRPTDTISRFGGDEFTLMCQETDEVGASIVATRILDSLTSPFSVGGHELFVNASIGIAICRAPGTPAGALLRDADAAMYRAKDEGRNGYAVFDGGMRMRATARLELENDLRRALDHKEFELVYQPDVDLASGVMVGVEALLRWRHPRRGVLAPGQFIETAEDSGLIVPIGEWVVGEACRQAREWQEQGHRLTVAVNVSPLQLVDPGLLGVLEDTLRRTGADPQLLTLEITESAAVHAGAPTLEALKRHGVRLALDDFGSGYSSLSQIRSMPVVDTLKIDRLFTEQLGQRPADTAIVAAIIRMADAMGMNTVAEGIETAPQARIVRRLGCERGQGYHFGRPVPASVVGDMLVARTVA